MKKWEYKYLPSSNGNTFSTELSILGSKGWRVVSINLLTNTSRADETGTFQIHHVAILEREIPDEQGPIPLGPAPLDGPHR